MSVLSTGDTALEKEKARIIKKKERIFYPGMYAYVHETESEEMLCVQAGEPIEKAIQIMLQENVNYLPVIEAGTIVGTVRAGELFKSCLKSLENGTIIS